MAIRGMYGLPQAGLLANKLLEKRLNENGYCQTKLVPGLWKHDWRPIQFTLVVNDFGVKYIGKEHAIHLKGTLEHHYKVTNDWTGKIHRHHSRLGLQAPTSTLVHAWICGQGPP
ncbi:hypothetical protein ACHAXR_006701 [Thalassiosira sp. AJA248-18]